MKELGVVHIPEENHSEWNKIWESTFERFSAIQDLAVSSSLHLKMISEYAPEEIEELTETILRNMPKNYTEKDAIQYEKEYMEAYEQLRQEVSQKKNLWDRFLDILAGGAQQSPAQMVMMKRWVDGEKGDL